MNSPRSHASSLMTSAAARPPIVAWNASGNWVEEWLPQITRSRTSATVAPARRASERRPRVLVEHGHREPPVARDVRRVRGTRSGSSCCRGCPRPARARRPRRSLRWTDPAPVKIPALIPAGPCAPSPPARHGAHQQRPVRAPERLVGLAVVTTPRRSGNAQSSSSMATPSSDGRAASSSSRRRSAGLRPEHLARGDPEHERVADLACRAGHGHRHMLVGHWTSYGGPSVALAVGRRSASDEGPHLSAFRPGS